MLWSQAKAVVSGAASGLGLAVVQRIVKAGGQAAMLDCNAAATATQARKLGKRALAVTTDVGNDASVESAVDAANNAFGGINLAVNCAGVLFTQKMLGKETVLASCDFEHVLSVNVLGTFRVCRAVAEVMRKQTPEQEECGVIINTASIAAFDGQIGQLPYCASKGAIVSMTLPMARELARHQIRVFAIAPGMFATPMLNDVADDVKAQLTAHIPFPARMGRPDEFAQMVQHVFENPMLNGSVIRLDGALRMPAVMK